jgi:hypothetical protein
MAITPAVGDGLRTEFFFKRNIVPQFLTVYADGLRMVPGADYELVLPRRIRFAIPPSAGADFVSDMFEYGVIFQGKYTNLSIWSEYPQGDINGVNRVFTLYENHYTGTLRVYLNGQRMRPTTDYNVLTTSTFQFAVAPASGSTVLVDYVEDKIGVTDFVSKLIFNEVPTALSAVAYQIANANAPGTIHVYLNTQRMKLISDYTEIAPDKFVFLLAPPPGSSVLVDYCKVS